MTPAEQYRQLVSRLEAILESTPDAPLPPQGELPGFADAIDQANANTPAAAVPHAQDPAQRQQGMLRLKRRAEVIVQRLATVAGKGHDYALIVNTQVIVVDDPDDDDMYSVARTARVYLDYSQWDDAPDNVLTWSIAHEVGHIVMDHRKAASPQHSQQQELAADAYATRLCLSMGISRAPAFKWANDKRDRLQKLQSVGTLHQNKLNQMSNPANSDYYKNQASHPTYQQRFDAAGQQGFDLSKTDTDQLDRFLAHMTRSA
jgi:hypothetical protein